MWHRAFLLILGRRLRPKVRKVWGWGQPALFREGHFSPQVLLVSPMFTFHGPGGLGLVSMSAHLLIFQMADLSPCPRETMPFFQVKCPNYSNSRAPFLLVLAVPVLGLKEKAVGRHSQLPQLFHPHMSLTCKGAHTFP